MESCNWFAPGSMSFEMAKGLPAAFVTLVIGGLAAYIAWHQSRVARAKLNLDLFDKRYGIFEATWTQLSKAIQQSPETPTNPIFTNLLPQAQFLFGLEIRNYMSEISDNTTELWMIQAKTKGNNDIIPANLIQRDQELMEWFTENATDGCRAYFGPYLDFSEWH